MLRNTAEAKLGGKLFVLNVFLFGTTGINADHKFSLPHSLLNFSVCKEELTTGISLENRVKFKVFMAVTMNTRVIWDVTPCDSCKNRRSSLGISTQLASVASYS
jgi:hypothetical protein